MRQYDRNGDGRVDFSEFQRYVAAKEAAISRAFAALDLDRDGKVTDAEVTVAMR
jgi:Ca2+-binding EF-hand superfamily protein